MTNGVQLHVEILELDTGGNRDELIDRFVMDITNPIGSTSERHAYTGIFALAQIELTATVQCTEYFIGPNCDVLCLENCLTCNCGQNEIRVNGTCVCDDGDISQVIPAATATAITLLLISAVVLFIVAALCRRKWRRSKDLNNANSGAVVDNRSRDTSLITDYELSRNQAYVMNRTSGLDADYDYPTIAFREQGTVIPTSSDTGMYNRASVCRDSISCEPCPAYSNINCAPCPAYSVTSPQNLGRTAQSTLS